MKTASNENVAFHRASYVVGALVFGVLLTLALGFFLRGYVFYRGFAIAALALYGVGIFAISRDPQWVAFAKPTISKTLLWSVISLMVILGGFRISGGIEEVTPLYLTLLLLSSVVWGSVFVIAIWSIPVTINLLKSK